MLRKLARPPESSPRATPTAPRRFGRRPVPVWVIRRDGPSAVLPRSARCRPRSARSRCPAERPAAERFRQRRERYPTLIPVHGPATAQAASVGRSTRTTLIGPSQSSPPLKSNVVDDDDGGNSWRKLAGPVTVITESRTLPLAVRSRSRTAVGASETLGRVRSTSGAPRPRRVHLPSCGLEGR